MRTLLQHAVYDGVISVNHLNIPIRTKILNIWVYAKWGIGRKVSIWSEDGRQAITPD